jgi:hypothetical protein
MFMPFPNLKNILIGVVLFSSIGFLNASVEDITNEIEKRNKKINNATIDFTYTNITSAFKGTKEQIRNRAQELANTAIASVTTKPLSPTDQKQLDDTKLELTKSLIESLPKGNKKSDDYKLFFDPTSARLFPSKLVLEENSHPVEYYSKFTYLNHYPACEIIVISNRDNLNATNLGVMLDIFREVSLCRNEEFGKLPQNGKVINDKHAIKVLSKNGDYDCEFEFENTTNYNLIKYSRSCLFDKSKVVYSFGNYSEINDIVYPNKINIDVFIDNILKNTTQIVVHSITFNTLHQDSELMPSDLPITYVQDDRFKPTLHYPVKGKLLSDEQLLEFAEDEKKLHRYITLFHKLN